MNNTITERLVKGEFVLIAEIGVNYYDIAAKLNISLMEAAKFMILSAKNAGIHAVKFQTYKADALASKKSPSYWDTSEEPTNSQYELFQKFDHFGEADYIELNAFCERIGIEFCSTPFDVESADYLNPLMNVYKISSSDLSNLPFIEHIAKKNKPIMLSIGASNENEIRKAVETIEKYNNKKITLLHCVLEYPTPYEDANLAKIHTLKEKFPQCYIGYSDHTKPDVGSDIIKTAYILGAQVVEKHFTLDKTLTGNDHYHAMDPHDAEEILKAVAYVQKISGKGALSCLKTEAAARKNARRSLVAVHAIAKGMAITKEMLTFKRPGTGISPAEIERVIGRKAMVDIQEDEILTQDMIEPAN